MAWCLRHQAITWTNVDLSMRFSDNLGANDASAIILKTSLIIAYIKFYLILPGSNECCLAGNALKPISPQCWVCASVNWVIIGWGNGLSPVGHEAITSTNVERIVNETLTNKPQWNLNQYAKIFNSLKCIWKCCLQYGGYLSQWRWVKSLAHSKCHTHMGSELVVLADVLVPHSTSTSATTVWTSDCIIRHGFFKVLLAINDFEKLPVSRH